MNPSLFQRLGGRPGMGRIVDGLYDRLENDPALKTLFRISRPGERARQKLSFEELFGGEPRYSEGGFRHYGMQRRHVHKTISAEASALWLGHFRASMAEAGVDAATIDEVIEGLTPVAYRLTNAGASFQTVKATLALAAKGDLEGVRQAVEAEPALLNQRGRHGVTLLWEASRRGRLPIVRWLADRGAGVNIPGAEVDEASVLVTPYCIATKMGRSEVARYLLDRGASVDVFAAAYLGDVAALTAMVTADAGAVNARTVEEDFFAVTPLHYAVDGRQIDAARLLIERGAEVERYSGRLLHLAARQGDIELTRLLLDHGADARQAQSLGPVDAGDATIARLLIERGLDINKPVAAGRETFLTMACRGDKGEHPLRVRTLLELGADVDGANGEGRTALHQAARAGFAKVIEVLLAAGADVDARDAAGATALDLATAARRAEAAAMLRAVPRGAALQQQKAGRIARPSG